MPMLSATSAPALLGTSIEHQVMAAATERFEAALASFIDAYDAAVDRSSTALELIVDDVEAADTITETGASPTSSGVPLAV